MPAFSWSLIDFIYRDRSSGGVNLCHPLFHGQVHVTSMEQHQFAPAEDLALIFSGKSQLKQGGEQRLVLVKHNPTLFC